MSQSTATNVTLKASATYRERHATWLELLFDLAFVVTIANIASHVKADFTLMGIGTGVILLLPALWIWNGHTVLATRFDSDDLPYRLMTFAKMFAVMILAIELKTFRWDNTTVFASAYITARLALWLMLWRVWLLAPAYRYINGIYLTGFGTGLLFWVVGLFCPSPLRLVLFGLGLGLDYLVPWIVWFSPEMKRLPVDASHLPERIALLTLIVLCEVLAAVVNAVGLVGWSAETVVLAAEVFGLTVLIWLSYFQFYEQLRGRVSLGSGQPFIYSHLPLIMSIIAIAIGSDLVIRFYRDPEAQTLAEQLLCVGLMVWLTSLWLIHRVSLPLAQCRRTGPLFLSMVSIILVVALCIPYWPPQGTLAGVLIVMAMQVSFQRKLYKYALAAAVFDEAPAAAGKASRLYDS